MKILKELTVHVWKDHWKFLLYGSNGRYLADISLMYRDMSAERINFFQILKLYLATQSFYVFTKVKEIYKTFQIKRVNREMKNTIFTKLLFTEITASKYKVSWLEKNRPKDIFP
jgi:hypothetical protein